MEHLEDVLFNAERALMRRYPSRAAKIAEATKELWHRDAAGVFYCGVVMSQRIGIPADTVTPFYASAEREAEAAEQERQQVAHDRRRRLVMAIWGAVVVAAGAWVVLHAA